jgi:hypothetical protein
MTRKMESTLVRGFVKKLHRDPGHNFADSRLDEMYGPSPRSSVWLLLTGGSLQRVHGDVDEL